MDLENMFNYHPPERVTFGDDNTYTAKLIPGITALSGVINMASPIANPIANPIATVVNLIGSWASGGITGPFISISGNAISVDMSAYQRPFAAGSVLDNSNISQIRSPGMRLFARVQKCLLRSFLRTLRSQRIKQRRFGNCGKL